MHQLQPALYALFITYTIHIQIIIARVKGNFKIIKLLSISCKLGSNVHVTYKSSHALCVQYK